MSNTNLRKKTLSSYVVTFFERVFTPARPTDTFLQANAAIHDRVQKSEGDYEKIKNCLQPIRKNLMGWFKN